MKLKFKIHTIIFLLLCCYISSEAAQRYWVGTGSNTNWNTTANWSLSSGGSSGASVPGSGDTARFDGGGTGQCKLNVNVSVNRWVVASGYTDTIKQNGNTITIGVGGASLSDGKFYCDTAAVTVNGSFDITGTDFQSTSGLFIMAGDFTYSSGTFTHNSGRIKFTTTDTITGTVTFYNAEFGASSARTHTINYGFYVAGELKISGSGAQTLNTGYIYAQGDVVVTNSATGGGGTATINMSGSSDQDIIGSGTNNLGSLPSMAFLNFSDTVWLRSVISVNGDWYYLFGYVEADTSTVSIVGQHTILNYGMGGGPEVFNILEIYNDTVSVNGYLHTKDLLIDNGGALLASSLFGSSITGDWTDNGEFIYATSDIVFTGAGTQYISKSGGEEFYELTVNKPSGILELNSDISIVSNLNFTRGYIIGTSGDVIFLDDATASSASDTSFVMGDVTKVGDDAFAFPLGDTALAGAYRPIGISAPSSTGDSFTMTYLAFDPASFFGSTRPDSLEYLSDCEFWFMTRNSGTSVVIPSLSWNSSSCVDDMANLVVAGWDAGTFAWLDLGDSLVATIGNLGWIMAQAGINQSYAAFTLGLRASPEGASVLSKLDGGYYKVSRNRLFFVYDEEYNDLDGLLSFTIYDADREVVATDADVSLIFKQNRFGRNIYGFNVQSFSGGLTTGYYILEVVNEKKEKRYLRFKI